MSIDFLEQAGQFLLGAIVGLVAVLLVFAAAMIFVAVINSCSVEPTPPSLPAYCTGVCA